VESNQDSIDDPAVLRAVIIKVDRKREGFGDLLGNPGFTDLSRPHDENDLLFEVLLDNLFLFPLAGTKSNPAWTSWKRNRLPMGVLKWGM
jgi:hypothetical protein